MKPLKLVSWNVNGIRAAAKKGFHDWFKSTSADIICLQETKASPEQLDVSLTQVEGYHAFFSSSTVKKGYSGVVIYTRHEPKTVYHGMGEALYDNEGRIVATAFDDFTLYNVYFPNGKASKERLKYKLDFYEAFQKHVSGQITQGKGIVVCGDVNTAHKEIDLARPKENVKISGFLPEERAWMDRFFEAGFVDTFRIYNQEPGQYTWWDQLSRARDRNVGWRIDYFFVSQNIADRVRGAGVHPDVMGSDHCPVSLEIVTSLKK
ncbi:MAG: exodeoxyribonuclease III [Candidatus Zixiibacteriota bacterium]